MRENFVRIPLLQQREIEMRVIGPLIRAFAKEFGEERTYETVRRIINNLSFKAGQKTAERTGKGLKNLKKQCMPAWTEGGALDIKIAEDTEEALRFDVTRCDYATIYRELGFGDIGSLVSCGRDRAFINGFDKDIEFSRKRTIMEGASACDFCYREHEK